MGQCQYCRRVKDDPSPTSPCGGPSREDENGAKSFGGSDSALDSDHSGDEGSCSGMHGALRLTRSGHSSQSSGKYSLRGSFSSCGEYERHEYAAASANDEEDNDEDDDDDDEDEGRGLRIAIYDDHNRSSTEEIQDSHLHPLQNASKWRKLSRGSNESERGSMTSMSSLTSELRARLGRSISLKLQRSRSGRSEGLNTSPWKGSSSSPKKPRSVSLRLPRRQKRPRNFRNKLPTIYVDDTEIPKEGKEKLGRKMSLRRTFSLLNVSSLNRQNSQPESKPQRSQQQKPVQKILRQPRRRHNTVRGISGMAIDGSNRTGVHSTRYYPTNTSLRVATPANVLYL